MEDIGKVKTDVKMREIYPIKGLAKELIFLEPNTKVKIIGFKVFGKNSPYNIWVKVEVIK
jgi:hypothetical protein